MRIVSFAIASSFIFTAGLFWYVNAANGYVFVRTETDVAVVAIVGVLPWLLALTRSVSDPSNLAGWVFSLLSLAAALFLLGTFPSGDAVSFNSVFLLVAVWGSYGFSRFLVRKTQAAEQ
jgi:hypothetical protein